MSLHSFRSDEGSLPLAMLLIIVGTGLSLVLSSTVLQELGNTRVEIGRQSALMAARTGVTSAVATLRAAQNTDGVGDPSLLPCVSSPTVPQLGGTAGGIGGSYETYILYLAQDPTGQTMDWIKNRGRPCFSQLGQIPRFAHITSVGTAGTNAYKRTLIGTYAFKSIQKGNMPGGHFRIYKTAGSANNLCLDAGAMQENTIVQMRQCATTASGDVVPKQKFGYQPDLTISLVTADTSLYPNGLCVETGWPQAVKQTLRLQQCGTTTLRRQIWSFNYASSFFGTTDGTTMNNLCWSVDQADTIGSQIKLNDTSGGLGNGNTPCNTNFPNNIQSWDMAAEVGPGAAGPATGQIVNFKQFGKCMDQAFELWDQKIFPCKQGPDPKVRDWNQIWFLSAAGQSGTISHDRPGMGRFCLQAPPLTSVPPTTNVVECPAVGPVPQNLVWRSRGADTPTYDERYRLEGTGPWAGYCLQPMPEVPAGVQGSRLGIKPCSGDYLQKWNATPPVTVSGLRNLAEL